MDVCSSLSCQHAERCVQTSAMSSARPGLQSSSQRLGVMPLVLFWNFFGSISLKSRNLSGKHEGETPGKLLINGFSVTLVSDLKIVHL